MITPLPVIAILSSAGRCVKRAVGRALAATALLAAGAAMADVGTPCPRPVISTECSATGAHLVLAAPPGGAAGLQFLVTAQDAGLLASDQAIRLVPGGTARVALAPGATAQARRTVLAVLGREPGADSTLQDCCFSNVPVTLAACPVAGDGGTGGTGGTGQPPASPPPIPPVPATDRGVTLTLAPDCARNTAGAACSGQITLTGDAPPGAQTVALTTDPPLDLGVTPQPAAPCIGARGRGALCDLTAPGQWQAGFALPPQAPGGPVTICAALGPAADPALRVLALQRALSAAGYDPGPADGIAGPATRAAVGQARAAIGLPPDPDADLSAPPEPTLAAALNLLPHADRDPANDRACALVTLPAPPLVCDRASTRRAGDGCACRFDGMIRQSATACACPKGTRLGARGCERPATGTGGGTKSTTGGGSAGTGGPKPPACDRLTTVARDGACACRYGGMVRLSATLCLCETGLPPVPGIGCVTIRRRGTDGAGP